MTKEKVKGKVRIYACGGTGINIGAMMENRREDAALGAATVHPVYIDTSASNVSHQLPVDQFYHFKDPRGDLLDGSGQLRREHLSNIAPYIKEILQKFEPMDINIVISSGSGGSGSVIAPSIAAELLRQNKQVVVIVVGATESRMDINNTSKTLKSYDKISSDNEVPVVIGYFENSSDTPRSEVDKSAVRLICSLMVMYSRENKELDSTDLYNFLNFHRVTTFPPQLASIHVHSKEMADEITQSVITVATLLPPGEESLLDFTPDYHRVGYLDPKVDVEVQKSMPLHVITTSGLLQDVSNRLEKRLEELDKKQNARVNHGRIHRKDDDSIGDVVV